MKANDSRFGPDFPMYVDLRRRGSFQFTWWLSECKARGYSVFLAWNESHAIALPPEALVAEAQR